MSFSGKVKEELLEHYARARHCDIAELSAIVHMSGEFKTGYKGVCCLKVHTENVGVARKCFTLLSKTFNIKTDTVVRRNAGKDNYSYYIYARGEELLAIRDTIVQAVCCKRAYLLLSRGMDAGKLIQARCGNYGGYELRKSVYSPCTRRWLL